MARDEQLSLLVISSEARNLCHSRSNELCQKSVNGKPALRRPLGIASTKKIGAKRRTTTLKFECRDEWLGIRDWGLGVTGILRHRHPERSRGIFTALRESVCMRRGKTMSWCCLISGDERSAIKIEGYARNDDAREALSKLHGASIFLCAAPLFLIPHLSKAFIPDQGTTRPMGFPRTLNPEPSPASIM